MYKRMRLAALMIVTLLLVSACATPAQGKPQDLTGFLVKEGIALTGEMDKLAETKEYVALMSASGNIGELIDKAAAGDYTAPENAYVVKLTDGGLKKAIGAFAGEADVPENVLEILKYKVNAAMFANLINAAYGSEMVAATSLLTWGKSYIQPEGWAENTILVLEYLGELSSMVSFTQSGEGVISATSVFMKNGETDIATMLTDYLGGTGIAYEQYDAAKVQELLGK
ncbi:MAG: hypothetical protein AAGU77_08460 [Bacillota bacterium]